MGKGRGCVRKRALWFTTGHFFIPGQSHQCGGCSLFRVLHCHAQGPGEPCAALPCSVACAVATKASCPLHHLPLPAPSPSSPARAPRIGGDLQHRRSKVTWTRLLSATFTRRNKCVVTCIVDLCQLGRAVLLKHVLDGEPAHLHEAHHHHHRHHTQPKRSHMGVDDLTRFACGLRSTTR